MPRGRGVGGATAATSLTTTATRSPPLFSSTCRGACLTGPRQDASSDRDADSASRGGHPPRTRTCTFPPRPTTYPPARGRRCVRRWQECGQTPHALLLWTKVEDNTGEQESWRGARSRIPRELRRSRLGLERRTWRRSVVLPAPRKPERSVIGTFLAGSAVAAPASPMVPVTDVRRCGLCDAVGEGDEQASKSREQSKRLRSPPMSKIVPLSKRGCRLSHSRYKRHGQVVLNLLAPHAYKSRFGALRRCSKADPKPDQSRNF